MEARNPVVIAVDEVEIVELLQHIMRRIEQDARAGMIAHRGEEPLPRRAIVNVLARMDLIGAVDPRFLEHVEDRHPAPREFGERLLDQAGRPLRPRIDIGPGQRAREGRVRRKPEPRARSGGQLDLLDRPRLAFRRLAVQLGRGEPVEQRIICGVHRNQLALQMGR